MRRRGITVVETLIVCGLLLTLMTAIYLMLSQATRAMKQTEAYASAQGQAHAVIRSLVREMSSSVDRWVVSTNDYVRFLSARPLNNESGTVSFDSSSGRLIWKKWVCYYLKTSGEVVRSQVALTPETSQILDEPMPRYLRAQFESQPSVSRRAVARNIEKLSISGAGTSSYDVEVVAVVKAATPGRTEKEKEARVRLVSRIVMINKFP